MGDFFKHGFDGSGADNFFDAGSCIDGRLTSAWNWCSTLEKKRFFHVFLLTGKRLDFVARVWDDVNLYPRFCWVRWSVVVHVGFA